MSFPSRLRSDMQYPRMMRRTVQLMVILTILAWATQTLFRQWGYGGLIVPPSVQRALNDDHGAATIEVRAEATIDGSEVTLRDLCHWPGTQEAQMAPLKDAVVIRLSQAHPVGQVTVAQIKAALHDAGVNLAQL